MTRPSSRVAVQIGGVPRVDLLPPEIASRERDRRIRYWSLVLVVVVVAALVFGYGLASVRSTVAQVELADAQAQTQQILLEQQQYAEVTRVHSALEEIAEVQTISASTEVVWKDLIADVIALVPAGSSVESIVLTGDSPMSDALVPAGELRSLRYAAATIILVSPTLTEPAAFIDALRLQEYVSDVTADSSSGPIVYRTTMSINFSDTVLSKRFTEEYVPRADGAASPSPSPTETPDPGASDESGVDQ